MGIYRLVVFVVTLFLATLQAQVFNAQVMVNYEQVKGSNDQIFQTLERDLKKFINATAWTKETYQDYERINCNFTLVINKKTGTNDYGASLQIQSSRPVFNTMYQTPIINLQDSDVSFSYAQYQPLTFNERAFTNNLVDVLAFYVYMILGYDADTFALNGGNAYFEKADKIVNNAQQKGYGGWDVSERGKNRNRLVKNLLATDYALMRQVMYGYHRTGLDQMYMDSPTGKEIIAENIISLKQFVNNKASLYTLDIFLEAKTNEIVEIFSGEGSPPKADVEAMKKVLNTLAPTKASEWKKIKA